MTNLILLGGPSLIDLHVWQRLSRQSPVHPLPRHGLRRRGHLRVGERPLGHDRLGRRLRPHLHLVPAAAAAVAPRIRQMFSIVSVLEVLPDVDHVEAVERGEVRVGVGLLEDALGGAGSSTAAPEHGTRLARVDEAAGLARGLVGDWKIDPTLIYSLFMKHPTSIELVLLSDGCAGLQE